MRVAIGVIWVGMLSLLLLSGPRVMAWLVASCEFEASSHLLEPRATSQTSELRRQASNPRNSQFAIRNPQSAIQLVPGAPIERELAAGEVHAYQVTLAAGQYLRVVVDQRGLNVVVTVVGPDGQPLGQRSTPEGYHGLAPVSVIAEASGPYRLEVRLLEVWTAPGRYEIRIEEWREAQPPDRSRATAEQTLAEAVHLQSIQLATEARRRALIKYEEGLRLFRALGDRRGEAVTLYGLGSCSRWTDEMQKALDFLTQALALFRALGDRPGEAQTLADIGGVYFQWRQLDKAEPYFHQALALFRALGDRQGEAKTRRDLGWHYAWHDKPEKALEYYRQALDLFRAVGDGFGEAATLENIGNAYDWLGEKETAIEHLRHALTLYRAIGNRRQEGVTLIELGWSQWLLGEHQPALDHYRQALALFRALKDRENEAHALNGIGLIYDLLGEPQKALEYHHQALALCRAAGYQLGEARTLIHIGLAYRQLGEYQRALEFYQQALQLSRAQRMYREEGTALNYLGAVYESLDEPQQALEPYQQALAVWRAVTDQYEETSTLANIGSAHHRLGERQKALEYYDQALQLSRAGGNRPGEAQTLYGIARVERESGHLTRAQERMEAALAITESLRTNAPSQELRASYLASKQDYYEFYLDLLMRLHQRQPSSGYDAAALHASERARARSLLELLAEARIDVQQGIDPPLKEREKNNQSRLSWLQSQLIQARSQAKPDPNQIAALDKQLKQTDAEREQIEIEIRQKHPQYADLQYPTPLDLAAIQKLLDGRTALLEYALGEEGSFLFVVSQDRLHSFRLPPAKEINQLVQDVRDVIAQPNQSDAGQYLRAARELYDTLVAPAAPLLATKRHLVIVPDGSLHYLPFESLLTQPVKVQATAHYATLPYLLKRWAVSYVSSASVLASLRQRKPDADRSAEKAFVAFADPVYEFRPQTSDLRPQTETSLTRFGSVAEMMRDFFSDRGQLKLPRLVDSQREVTRVAKLHRPTDVALYLRQDATEETVKQNTALSLARRIHFATHGVMSEKQPQHSGLVLTLDDDPKEDGLLQVYEIFNLKLNADLVVLSACRTGLGKEVKGEGLIGLTRAFMYAGAQSVVVSLWRVADRPTADLMVKFYRHLPRAADKAEALRRAKLEMLEAGGRFAHPLFWASFILVGEPK